MRKKVLIPRIALESFIDVSGVPDTVRLLQLTAVAAYFSDRGRPFQADRGRRNGVAAAALGKRAGTGLTVHESSTISLKRAAVGWLSGLVLNLT